MERGIRGERPREAAFNAAPYRGIPKRTAIPGSGWAVRFFASFAVSIIQPLLARFTPDSRNFFHSPRLGRTSGLEPAGGILHRPRVLLFKQILDFKQAALARLRDKRKGTRYPVGPGFPLKGTVGLKGGASQSCDWSGQLANISPTGVSLMLPPAATTVRGEKTTLCLRIEQHVLELPCVVAHFRVLATHSVCGLSLEFPNFTVQKGFAQLLEAVKIGATLAPVKVPSSRRGATVEQYKAGTAARLSVWRKGDEIERFELVIGEHSVRGEAYGDLEIQARAEGGDQPGTNVREEVRRLYRWLLPNLNKQVPADVRDFLKQAGTKTRPVTSASNAPQLSTAPGPFPPPRPRTRPPQVPR